MLSSSNATSPPWTLTSIRDAFPIKRQRTYLNNASIGPMSTPVISAMERFLSDVRDNGRNNYPNWCSHADLVIREKIARLIGASASEIAFVKNTTEGLNIVANGLAWRPGDNVVVANIEYSSNVYCWMHLAKLGVEVRWVESRGGRLPVDAYAEAIDSRTRLVTLSGVQFASGYRHDLALMSQLCKDRGALLNVDAIQLIGALDIDVEALQIDFLSAGGHKWMMAPIGTGFFYCSRRSLELLDPPSVGYHSVAKHEAHMDYELVYRPDAARFEEALVNYPGIYGLEAAVDVLLNIGPAAIENHILGLNQQAAALLQRQGWVINSSQVDAERSGILMFTKPGIDPHTIVESMKSRGVDIATRGGALRMSPSYYNDSVEVERFVSTLSDCVR